MYTGISHHFVLFVSFVHFFFITNLCMYCTFRSYIIFTCKVQYSTLFNRPVNVDRIDGHFLSVSVSVSLFQRKDKGEGGGGGCLYQIVIIYLMEKLSGYEIENINRLTY